MSSSRNKYSGTFLLGSVFAIPVYILLEYILYRDIIKNQGQNDIKSMKKNKQVMTYVYAYVVFLFIFLIWLLFSFVKCFSSYVSNSSIIKKYKPVSPNKKVKDMTSQQKKRRKQYLHATRTNSFYLCDPKWFGVKIWTMISTIIAVFIHNYARKNGTIGMFMLMSVLLTPLFILISVITVVLVLNSKSYYF